MSNLHINVFVVSWNCLAGRIVQTLHAKTLWPMHHGHVTFFGVAAQVHTFLHVFHLPLIFKYACILTTS